MKRFGEKLRRLRQEQSLTVRQLASLMNMKSHSHITDMENGRSLPSVELLVKLADFFQVTTDQLLRDELEID
ncbi:helix-turn-helix domain-containing protein [Chloroflexi bacterium TSY]|nr:helix-turn-helix domain-containing protein [Chloroflexi bacterium TSY]